MARFKEMLVRKGLLIVTGGSRGIGAATAIRAAKDGWDVAVNYARDAEAADRVALKVRAAGCKAITVQGDMNEEADILRLFELLFASFHLRSKLRRVLAQNKYGQKQHHKKPFLVILHFLNAHFLFELPPSPPQAHFREECVTVFRCHFQKLVRPENTHHHRKIRDAQEPDYNKELEFVI